MSKEKIIEKIEKDCKKEIDTILKDAKKVASEIRKKTLAEARETSEHILSEAKRESENIKQTIIAKANQNARRKLLEGKEKIIKECLEKAKEKLFKLKGDKYKKTVEKLIKNGIELFGKDCMIIPSRKEDVEVAKKLKVKVDEKRKTGASGGVIIVSKDGLQSINNTFDGILERKIDKIKTEIGKMLFK